MGFRFIRWFVEKKVVALFTAYSRDDARERSVKECSVRDCVSLATTRRNSAESTEKALLLRVPFGLDVSLSEKCYQTVK